jgi:uncharacterized protein (TIGR03790 family)
MRWNLAIVAASWLALLAPAIWGQDISPKNVLVLYNPAWSQGSYAGNFIADYYANERGIPMSNVVGITGLGASEDISAQDYLTTIYPQVEAALAANPNIDVIVTTKGMPLRVDNTMPNPAVAPSYEYTYTDNFGVSRTLLSSTWEPYSSLEGDLAAINSIGPGSGSSWLNTAETEMGDQTWWDTWDYPTQPACNPYYRVTAPFSHSNPAYDGMYLASRLDGYTVANVVSSINKAQHVYVVPNSAYVVADSDPNAGGDLMGPLVSSVLKPAGQDYIYDTTSSPHVPVTTAPGPVIGYVSHGVHGGGLYPGYIQNQLNFTFANGAVFDSYESFNAYSFEPGGGIDGQGLVADWLAVGGTAGVGNVQEPGDGPANVCNEDQMFQMLLDGYTFGEAAWSSLQQLKYVNTVVGDPLMTWQKASPGDALLTGTVDVNDLTIVLTHYGMSGQMWEQGNFTGSPVVDINDLTIVLTALSGEASSAAGGLQATPEPSALILLIFGALGLPVCARRLL